MSEKISVKLFPLLRANECSTSRMSPVLIADTILVMAAATKVNTLTESFALARTILDATFWVNYIWNDSEMVS